MDARIEELDSTKRKMTFSLLESAVESEVGVRAQKLSKTADIPGFRKGRVPVKIILSRYGNNIRNEVVMDLASMQAASIFNEKAIQPVQEPIINDYKLNEITREHEFTFSFEVIPEVSVTDVAGRKITVPKLCLDDDAVKDALTVAVERFPAVEIVDRPAKEGDRAFINYTIRNGNPAQEEPFRDAIDLNRDSVPEFLFNACIGLSSGEMKTAQFVHDFSDADETEVEPDQAKSAEEDSTRSENASRQEEDHPVWYDIEMLFVTEKVPNQLSENFLGQLGLESMDDENFDRNFKMKLQRDFSSKLKNGLKDQVTGHLMEQNEFIPPISIVTQRVIEHLKASGLSEKEINYRMQTSHKDDELARLFVTVGVELKLSIIMNAVMTESTFDVEEVVDEGIHAYAEQFPDSELALEEIFEDKENYRDQMVSDYLINCLMEKANCKEIEMSMAEFDIWCDEMAADYYLKSMRSIPGLFSASEEQPEAESNDSDDGKSIILDASGNPFEKHS